MNLSVLMGKLPLDQLGELRAEWESNSRLRLGVLAIWSLLLLYGALVLGDVSGSVRADLAELNERRDRLETIHAQQYWLQRADSAEAALLSVEGTFPVVASGGRAEAQIRTMLQEAVKELPRRSQRKLRVEVDTAQPQRDGKMWRVVATVRGVVPGEVARDFLDDLEARADYGRVINMKLIRGLTARKVRVNVTLEYLYRAAGR